MNIHMQCDSSTLMYVQVDNFIPLLAESFQVAGTHTTKNDFSTDSYKEG